MSSEQAALSIEQLIVTAAKLAADIGPIAIPIIQFAAGFFPGAAPVVQIITAALPYLTKITQYAPAVQNAIQAGSPVFDAFDKAQPELLDAFKNLFAMAKGTTPDQVSDADAWTFASMPLIGRRWTPEESQVVADRFGIGSQS